MEAAIGQAAAQKSLWQRVWPIMACGSGLFSDGYIQNVIGNVNTCLKKLYPDVYANSVYSQNVSSIAFVGTVVGQLFFGYISDKVSRKSGMIAGCFILILFSILCSGAWGAHGSIGGMLSALTAYRFLLGIGIGGEYPAGSVACSEATAEVKRGTRNRWFIFFTNFMIDFGFVIGAFVPLVVLWIAGENHLTPVWRVSLGLGAIPPLSILYFRFKLKEPEEYKRQTMRHTSIPYWLVIKFYWFRLICVSMIWFIYDFSSYSFSIYASSILAVIIPNGSLVQSFGWNVVINLFYIPGAFCGAFLSDWFGPKYCLAGGVFVQAIVGFGMAGGYGNLEKHVAGFAVVYGIFLSLGEVGPGDNIGLIASKTCATAVRGQYYGIAAATGKIGAFVGTWVFPVIIRRSGGADTVKGNQAPFYVSSALCIFSAALTLLTIPKIDQDCITHEDDRFRDYLLANNWDITQMGDRDVEPITGTTHEYSTSFDNEHNKPLDSEKAIQNEKTL